MKEDILVVTATLGDRETLKRTIESVKKYGGSRVKHVIIAPTDKCALLKIKYPSLEVLGEPDNCKGIYKALNYALIKFANDYKYLTFLNDDDFWLPNYANLIVYLDQNELIDVVYGRVKYVDEKGEIIGLQTCSGRYRAFKVLLKEGIILFTQQAALMRANVFTEIGGFDERLKLVADTKFWVTAINKGYKFHYLNLACAGYMLQKGQLSSDGNLQRKEHDLLDLSLNGNDFSNRLLEKFLFRVQNIGIYCMRLYKNKKIINMRTMFNQN